MKGLERFFSEFTQYCRDRDTSRIMNLNVDGDISGWGLFEEDIYTSRDTLHAASDERNRVVKTAEVIQHPVLVFGDDLTCCLVTEMDLTQHLYTGGTREVKGIRTSWFLEWVDDDWKIRHGHTSFPVSSADIVQRPLSRLERYGSESTEVDAVCSWLKKRTEAIRSEDVEGILSQITDDQGSLFFGVCKGEEARSVDECRDWYKKMFNEFSLDTEYVTPIVFLSSEYACLSCHGTTIATHKETGKTHTLQPVRSTFFLQNVKGEWLCRHGHYSLPLLPESI
ncbi:nuclear transport factor 2 family protein [Parendozoicomonas sp. Alg238-R29]|uniref:nuclear transport factor 2 family protein n=1 Tax=Parendozoicomonas sp. Alg238-R29 TaxID=2993446 RepID=UPI00248F1D53|nr:nuclear transport factor 2 family protein [Parendozoicomonas sp. Alg238-R29]